jgi:hypothetical protein
MLREFKSSIQLRTAGLWERSWKWLCADVRTKQEASCSFCLAVSKKPLVDGINMRLKTRQSLQSRMAHNTVRVTVTILYASSSSSDLDSTTSNRRSIVPGYRTEIYCVSCEVRTEFIYVM